MYLFKIFVHYPDLSEPAGWCELGATPACCHPRPTATLGELLWLLVGNAAWHGALLGGWGYRPLMVRLAKAIWRDIPFMVLQAACK